MALIKHSLRLKREGCRNCGSTQIYWAHDTDVPGMACTRPDPKTGKIPCANPHTEGKFTLINVDGTRHDCLGKFTNAPSRDTGSQPVPAPMPAPMPAPNGTPNGVPSPEADRLATAAALIEALSPKVDAAEVQRLINQQHDLFAQSLLDKVDVKISEITAPVTVKVQTERETKELPGLVHKSVPTVLITLSAGEHALMVGPAGTGKSTIAEQCAEALSLPYYSISLSPQTPASALLGYMQAAGEYVQSHFRKAYEHGGVFHFDEFDNAHPSVLAVINASLANGHMGFADSMVKRHPDFRVCASANTYGRGPDRQYVGRQALDAATLDRFTIVDIGIDEALERELCRLTGAASAVVDEVIKYVRSLRRNAEAHKMTLIFSPRASVGMCRLIHAGFSVDQAIEARARRGTSDSDWSKVTQGVGLPGI